MTSRSLLGYVSASLLLTGILLTAIPSAFAQTTPTVAPTVEFTATVQAGLQALSTNAAAQAARQKILDQDYKSTWDEFGMTVLIDGSASPADISHRILSDITQSISTARDYNQQESDFLRTEQMTPEEVQSIEQTTGVDAPPSEEMTPNPSLDANPDASLSPADVPIDVSTSEPDSTNGATPTGTDATSTTLAASTQSTAGLVIVKSVDNSAPVAGSAINYTIFVTALGPDISSAVTVSDTLPGGVTFIDATSTFGSYDRGSGTWTIGDMQAGSSATLTISALVDASLSPGTTITNSATVAESPLDANQYQDSAISTASITVAAAAGGSQASGTEPAATTTDSSSTPDANQPTP